MVLVREDGTMDTWAKDGCRPTELYMQSQNNDKNKSRWLEQKPIECVITTKVCDYCCTSVSIETKLFSDSNGILLQDAMHEGAIMFCVNSILRLISAILVYCVERAKHFHNIFLLTGWQIGSVVGLVSSSQ